MKIMVSSDFDHVLHSGSILTLIFYPEARDGDGVNGKCPECCTEGDACPGSELLSHDADNIGSPPDSIAEIIRNDGNGGPARPPSSTEKRKNPRHPRSNELDGGSCLRRKVRKIKFAQLCSQIYRFSRCLSPIGRKRGF